MLKRGKSYNDIDLPTAIIPGRPYDTPCQEEALERIGKSLLAGDNRYPALESILERRPFDRPIQTTDLDELERLLLGLDGGHLVIQGPPGSGKTWTSGRLIARLMAAGKTVGVASTSHKAIHNLVRSVEDAAAEAGLSFNGMKKASEGNPESAYEGNGRTINVTEADGLTEAELAAGTAWLFSRDIYDNHFDYLFIDEAGQVSLADALAMGTAARNVVLVGDPQQLDQVLQGTHPSGSDASVLKHLIGDEATIPADRGIFLERTYRLHPDICAYISDEFYESRLEPAPVAASGRRRSARACGTCPSSTMRVARSHRRRSPPSRRDRARARRGRRRAGRDHGRRALQRAGERSRRGAAERGARRDGRQVPGPGGRRRHLLAGQLERGGRPARARVPALAASARTSPISRARCLAYLVASPRLLEVNTRTIEQMRLANALCRFVELAT